MAEYIVELEPGVWLDPAPDDDPGRTRNRDLAQRYRTAKGARIALALARGYRPFKKARIVELDEETTAVRYELTARMASAIKRMPRDG